MNTPTVLVLPRAAPRRVLAFGAWLKNSAGLLEGDRFLPSALHGDLDTPEACIALERSVQALAAAAGGPIEAVAHDLHPDFHSTRLALHWAERLGVPAIGVQHHQAHLAVLQAEAGLADGPLLGLALDGVGLGTDGTAWGGELLRLDAHGGFERLAHLPPLALPGGDVAAREPWRLVAAVLHALGRGDEIEPRLAPVVGAAAAQGVRTMLARGLNHAAASRCSPHGADDAGARAELPGQHRRGALVRCGGRGAGAVGAAARGGRGGDRAGAVCGGLAGAASGGRGGRGPSRSRG